MNDLIEPVSLCETINGACSLARQLIEMLKREAVALAADNGLMSAGLAAAKAEFMAIHAGIFEQLRADPSLLGPKELEALKELEMLIADLATATLDSLIETYPEAAEYRYERAGVLLGQGRDAAATNDFLAVLKIQPSHFQALTDLGNLQMESGNHKAALGLFSQAVAIHPEQASARVNLADLLLSMTDYQAAKCHYEIALELQPGLNAAHQGLALALAGLGDEAAAAAHRESGFRGHALITWPHRGSDACLHLLVLSSAFGGNIPIRHVLDERTFHSSVILTEYFDPATSLPEHQLIINLIGDADLCAVGLEAAEALIVNSTMPVINRPALVRASGRLENSRRLADLPGVIAPHMALLPRVALMAGQAENLLAGHGIGFPLLLRSPGFHTGRFFVRVETPGDLPAAVAGLPGVEILAMQLLDARNRHGDYYKYRVMFVDGVLYPLHLAISKHWKVHYFSAAMNNEPKYRSYEAAFLRDMSAELGDKAIAGLDSIRQRLGLDYGGIDFAVGADGEILLFEANATMVVHRPDDHEKWAYRRTAAERILDAVRKMVISRALGS